MSTTLMPLDPALSPQRMVRVLTISANLLPDEVVAARRARRSRGWVLIAVILVVALLAAWYVWAGRRVSATDDDLSRVTQQATTLQKSQAKYQDVVNAQTEAATIAKKLKALLADDLRWARLLDTLRSTGAATGVTVMGVNAALNDPAAAGTVADSLPGTTKSTAGTIVITAGAPDKPSIAKYVDALSRLTSVANPYLTTATKAGSPGGQAWQFSVTVDISSTTLCGRFTTKCKASGGK
jgi:type IV pilus assembly protein PilN